DGFDVRDRGVHEIASGAAVDVNVDEPRRYIKAARVNHLRAGRNLAPGAHVIDAVALNQHHAIRNHAAIGDDGSVEEGSHSQAMAGYARIFFTTSPLTSVSRKSRP